MKTKSIALSIFLFLVSIIAPASAYAYEVPEKDWGIAAGFRIAKIPYSLTQEEQVSDFVPLMFYDGDIFFIRGFPWLPDDIFFDQVSDKYYALG